MTKKAAVGFALGAAVVYAVPADHHTETVKVNPDKSENRLEGSTHHPEQREFAGQVGRVNADGTLDLIIFPPNRAPVWVDGVDPDTVSAV